MRERSAAQSLFAGPCRPKQEGDEKNTKVWFSTPRAPSSGRAIPHLMPSLIQEAASRGGGGNLSGGPATTDAGIKKTASRPSPTRTRTSRVLRDHAKRPSPYPHLVSSLDKEGETRRGSRPNAAGKREGRHQQATRRAVPDDHVRIGNVEGRASVEAAWPAQRQHAADRGSESIGDGAEP